MIYEKRLKMKETLEQAAARNRQNESSKRNQEEGFGLKSNTQSIYASADAVKSGVPAKLEREDMHLLRSKTLTSMISEDQVPAEANWYDLSNLPSHHSSPEERGKGSKKRGARPLTTSPNGTGGFDKSDNEDEGNISAMVEMMERQRRSWHQKRTKLINTLHEQQIELVRKSEKAQDKAVSIAKEFSSVIEGFDRRLESVESNVQKEILSIKSISENLVLVADKLAKSSKM